MKKYLSTAVALVTVALIAGCGGNGPGNNSTLITGKVADGYLVGATVFLDKNGNYQLDADEPSATTVANGAYTLSIDPSDLGKYPVVALATKGVTVDEDDNLPVENSYVLSMHRVSVLPSPAGTLNGTVSNFISPISSQIREMMETGKYATPQQAMEELRMKLGMPTGTDMLGDYMAARHVGMHTAAKKIADIMRGQMGVIMGPGKNSPTVHIDRYRGMMGAIFSNISSIRASEPDRIPELKNRMTEILTNMPMNTNLPFRNMSSVFRGGMMGGRSVSGMMMGK